MSKKFKHLREFSAMQGGNPFVGPPSTPDVAADDIDVPFSLNDLSNEKHLARLNAYVSQIAARDYMNPMIPLQNLAQKLETIGVTVRMPAPFEYIEDGAILHIPILRFGGRFGMHPTEGWTDDDGYNGEGYVLELIFTQNKGMYSIDAEVISADQANDYEDVDDVEFADDEYME